jgi:nicotinate phosphoribosyltransferase
VFDFGSRRCAGPEAALMAARAAYIGGITATTNALASSALGLPVVGTMSDTFLAAYGDDRLAYDAFRLHFPGQGHFTLPDDDPVDGVRRFAGFRKDVQTVRVDHDDLGRTSRTVRDALDRNGMSHVRILGSGHLDEHRIRRLVTSDAPIQQFAVGRALAAASDRGMRMAFRIAEMMRGARPAPATREGSSPYPGRKQICRFPDRDVLCLEIEGWIHEQSGAKSLLRRVMVDGRRVGADPSLQEMRRHRAAQVAALPPAVRDVDKPTPLRMEVSDSLAKMVLGG